MMLGNSPDFSIARVVVNPSPMAAAVSGIVRTQAGGATGSAGALYHAGGVACGKRVKAGFFVARRIGVLPK